MTPTAPAWNALSAEATAITQTHLRTLLQDGARCQSMCVEHDGVIADFSRQNATLATRDKLIALAESVNLAGRIRAMTTGARINTTENRSVLHTALRLPPGSSLIVEGVDVAAQVHEVLNRIRTFSDAVRSGQHLGATAEDRCAVPLDGLLGFAGLFVLPLLGGGKRDVRHRLP